MRAVVAFGASLLVAAWLYIWPPKPPTGKAPVIQPFVREFPAGDPLSWIDEYRAEQYRERMAARYSSYWPDLEAEGNTSDL